MTQRKIYGAFTYVPKRIDGHFKTYPKGYMTVPYVPERVRENDICDWKGSGAVLPMPVTTILSYDSTRALPPIPVMNI